MSGSAISGGPSGGILRNGISASKLTYIVSSGALNSIYLTKRGQRWTFVAHAEKPFDEPGFEQKS